MALAFHTYSRRWFASQKETNPFSVTTAASRHNWKQISPLSKINITFQWKKGGGFLSRTGRFAHVLTLCEFFPTSTVGAVTLFTMRRRYEIILKALRCYYRLIVTRGGGGGAKFEALLNGSVMTSLYHYNNIALGVVMTLF